jgi:hypothetical protein
MADGIDDIRRAIVILPTEEKAIIAREALQLLGRAYSEEIASEFAAISPEEREDRQRFTTLMVSLLVIMFTLGLIAVTLFAAPEYLEVVLPVLTTILGAAGGYIFGKQTPSQQG